MTSIQIDGGQGQGKILSCPTSSYYDDFSQEQFNDISNVESILLLDDQSGRYRYVKGEALMGGVSGPTNKNDYIALYADDNEYHAKAGNDIIYGMEGHDRLYGEQGEDELFGGLGNDHLFGGEGNDHLSGGLGDDTLNGDLGNDVLRGGLAKTPYTEVKVMMSLVVLWIDT